MHNTYITSTYSRLRNMNEHIMRIFELRLRTILERNVPYFSENEGGVLV